MDAPSPEELPAADASGPKDWGAEFQRQLAEVEQAAKEWGVHWDELEGRFVAALLGAIRMLGGLEVAQRRSIEETLRLGRLTAEAELEQARELSRHARAGITQARNAQILLQVEQENLVVRMIKETLPLFAERLRDVLVIRERQLNVSVRRRHYVMAGAAVLGLFLSGYALRTWADWSATGALGGCLAHPLQASGHIYCDVTSFADAR